MSQHQELYDVVVIGAGPVGLMLSTCLARWGYKIKHIDNRPHPTVSGRADGIQPRSLDLLRNMGLKSKLMAIKPARVYEVAFWDPGKNGIYRTGSWPSCPKFIDARYPFTTLLHQGYIEQTFLEDMEKYDLHVQRPWTITGFKNDGKDPNFPVEVNFAHVDRSEETQTVRTKYLFGGEGGKSFIRESLKIPVHYKDPIAYVWGVMDGVVRTNFPDIKMKCTIHSDAGSIMVIPREENMVRLYIQIASSTDPDFSPRKTATSEEVMAKAKAILKPYYIEWDTVDWYSVYPIGQGLSERYTLDERVFLGGDACHTHSVSRNPSKRVYSANFTQPKAGQGMNTAFLDAVNLAWKIHHVEFGFANRSILSTYEPERRLVADQLLNFDAKYARLFSARLPSAGEIKGASEDKPAEENDFVKTFKESCEFTSGYGVAYLPNEFNWSPDHSAKSSLFVQTGQGTKLRTGRILTNATVTRVVDANVVHLEQEIPLNGSYRIYVFGGNPKLSRNAIHDFGRYLLAKKSFLQSYLRSDAARVSYHEGNNPHSLFFSFASIFNAERRKIEISELLPDVLARYADHVYADDIWDQRVPDAEAAAHAKMGLDEQQGGVVVVRPDGYVGCVVKLVEGSGTVDALNEYFNAFTTKKLGGESASL